MEVIPLVALHPDEDRTQNDGGKQPGQPGFTFFDGPLGPVIGEAAGHKKDRVDASEHPREGGVFGVRRPRVIGLPWETVFRPAKNKISPQQTCEEHGLRGEEHDHPKLAGFW